MLAHQLWHASITIARVIDAVERENITLDNPGFCLICGDETMECEPDACNHTCVSCGTEQVFGAAELLLYLGPV
jgi:hypothetical protein